MLDFLNDYDFTNLIRRSTCFKGDGSGIDLILTNRKYSFKLSATFETDLSDYHHLIYSMLKTTFRKENLKILILKNLRLQIFDLS